MCLTINDSKTQELKDRCVFKKEKKITVYKVVSNDNMTPYQRTQIKQGWLIATGNVKSHIHYNEIHGGAIHAYLNYNEAVKYAYTTKRAHKVIECYAWIDDLVAVGINDDVAFTKIYIPKL